jgi:hypothetical protein
MSLIEEITVENLDHLGIAEGKQSDIQKLNSKIEQEKNPALKSRKKLETTGFDTVTQAQNYLKSINKKLKLWEEQIFRNQVKKN